MSYNDFKADGIEKAAREELRREIAWTIYHLATVFDEAVEADAHGVASRIEAVQDILRRELDREAAKYIEAEALRTKKKAR